MTKKTITSSFAQILISDSLWNQESQGGARLNSLFLCGGIHVPRSASTHSFFSLYPLVRFSKHEQSKKLACKKETLLCVFLCFFFNLSFLLHAADIPKGSSFEISSKVNSSQSAALAKEHALDLAEASINEGFRVRDGSWAISLTPQEPQFLQVTLFEGNDYWFIAAAAPPALALKLTIYDSAGNLLKLDPWKETLSMTGARAAEEFKAPRSGNYFIKLELLKSEGKKKAAACFVYAYK